MNVTRLRIIATLIIANVIFWVPAYFSLPQTKVGVNAGFSLLSVMMTLITLWDVVDIFVRNGDGIRWQAAVGKLGLFTMAVFFLGSRVWAFILYSIATTNGGNYPDDLLNGPIGTYLGYGQGIGFGLLVLGFMGAGDRVPKINASSALVIAIGLGIIIGVAISHLPPIAFGG